jgi:glycosyltransferase involved in cell wall biosynthesis
MDWLPNIDGCNYFVSKILPIIRRRKPDCSFAIVGRSPGKEILDLAQADRNIVVSGTVPDILPYLWGSEIAIVPLRIGGGTRLKIYEAMAAKIPVVSTTVGAEGLPVAHGKNILLADAPEDFAQRCIELLESKTLAEELAGNAWNMVASEYSWEKAARIFEEILKEKAPQVS